MEIRNKDEYKDSHGKANVKHLIVAVLALQLFILIIRIISGLILKNSVLLLEGFHVFIDLSITSAVLITLRVIEGNYAKKFSYGLYKLDDLVSFMISIIVAFSAFDIAINSMAPENYSSIYSAWIQLSTLIPLAIAGILKINAGRLMGLGSLVEDGRHTYADVYEGLGVGVGLLLFSVLHQALFYYISIGIAVIAILITAYQIGKGSIVSLLDLPKDPSLSERVKDGILKDRGVEALKDLRLRWAGPVVFGEAIITVKPSLTIIEAHEIADRLERSIYEKFGEIRNISIHIEPSVRGTRKLLIPMDGNIISKKVSRARYFLIYNINDYSLLGNIENNVSSNFGKNFMEICKRMEITDVVCRDIGENTKAMLKGLGIRIWLSKSDNLEETLRNFKDNALELIN
ncbi:MAG: cation diffusion facilitator family transporter [Thermoplasmatales archaeon]